MKINLMRRYTIKLSCILLLFISAATSPGSAGISARHERVSANRTAQVHPTPLETKRYERALARYAGRDARAPRAHANGRDALPRELSAGQKLKQAESAADRLIERFHETLDFRTIYDEYFVTAPELRKLSLAFGEEANKRAHYDESLTERIFTSTMTYLHLYSESTLIQDKPSPEVEKAQAALKDCKIDGSDESRTLTSAEMEQCLAEMEQVSALLRKQFTPGVFQSELYLENVKKERLRAERNGHNVPRIEKGNAKFDISPETPVYIIRRESFDYYFIEENGAFKLFYVDILPNFKLF